MGKETGFLELDRKDRSYGDAAERIKHYREFVVPLGKPELRAQASRCMNCGIPYCHNGCPVNNMIPDWNHLVYEDDWKNALEVLHSTNNFPEFTGRICPAPCEESCTLNIDDQPVTIKSIECAIVDKGWEKGWITSAAAQAPHRQVGGGGRLRARPGWPARSSSRAPGTRSPCSRRTTGPAACCATASPTSRWKST